MQMTIVVEIQRDTEVRIFRGGGTSKHRSMVVSIFFKEFHDDLHRPQEQSSSLEQSGGTSVLNISGCESFTSLDICTRLAPIVAN